MKWNPYFDWCSILLTPKPIPPKQRKSGAKNRAFEEIVSTLHSLDIEKAWHPQNEWPWRERLFVMLVFSGPKEYIENCDVDNLSKAALDAYKGIVYADDRQIHYLIASKQSKSLQWVPSDKPSLTIGIKKIGSDFELKTIPPFFVTTDEVNTDKKPAQIFIQVNGRTLNFTFADSMTSKDFDKIKRDILSELDA